MHDLIDQAIKLSLSCNWTEAIKLNLEILEEDPKDIATLNRLARAYSEVGDKEAATKIYQAVLKIDKYNAIALKNLRLLPHQHTTIGELVKEGFIETPGLTKTISLIKLASREKLAVLSIKQKLDLCPKGTLISVQTTTKQSIGCLPDDVSFKIRPLLVRGYEYSCCVKAISDNSISIFLREIKRPKRAGYLATFAKVISR